MVAWSSRRRAAKVTSSLVVALLTLSAFLAAISTQQTSSATTSGSIQTDPYTYFPQYDSYMESFYRTGVASSGSGTGFHAYPTSEPSGGDYYNYWTDDAGKLLGSFTALGDTSYAQDAANFIQDNAIPISGNPGQYYLPQRVTNTSISYLHLHKTPLPPSTYDITQGPILNPSFEIVNTTLGNQPYQWTQDTSGGTSSDVYGTLARPAADGAWYMSTGVTSSGIASYYQQQDIALTTNVIAVYAHYDSALTSVINNGYIGNYTVGWGAAQSESFSATSTNQAVFSYYLYPNFATNFVVPPSTVFTLQTWVSASATLTGVTYGVQVNEQCGTTQSQPWGGEVTTSINVSPTPTLYSATISTGTTQKVVASGCSLHFVVYLNPNTATAYTFTVDFGSEGYLTAAEVPFLPTVGQLYNSATSFGFDYRPWGSSNTGAGAYVAMVTGSGTVLYEDGAVNTASIPNLVTPIYTQSFTGTANAWTYFTANAKTLATNANLNINSTINYLEFGVSVSSGGASMDWDNVYFTLYFGTGDVPPTPASSYKVGSYYYATNGLVGVENVSYARGVNVYEQTMSFASVVADENATSFLSLNNQQVQQALGNSPWISDFFIFDTTYSATANNYIGREIFPFSSFIGSRIPYVVYLSGNNGTSINVDMWVAANPFRNVYFWINETLNQGQDWLTPRIQMVNYGLTPVTVSSIGFGLGSMDVFMKYQPYFSDVRLSNGSIISGTHFLGDTVLNASSSYYVYNQATMGSTPVSLFWSGFRTPEFADGFMVNILNTTKVSEIDYVSNFFGHSVRFNLNENNLKVVSGGKSDKFVFQVVPLSKSMWTEPKWLLTSVLPYVLSHPGVDAAMPGSWGLDSLGFTEWALSSGSASAMTFAKQLWNSQYQDVEQRLHPPATSYNPAQQPEIYYRSLYTFGAAGLLLYPGNTTAITMAENIAQYAIDNQMNSHGLPFGLEEDGWAVFLLDLLTAQTGLSHYASDASTIRASIQYNTNYVPYTASTWPAYSTSNTEFTPSVWNLNSTGGVNAWSNHPQIVFRSGEMEVGFLTDSRDGSAWQSPAVLTAYTLIEEMSNSQTSGLAVDVRYTYLGNGHQDYSGNSNTETQAVTIVGLLAIMEAMQTQTGLYVSSIRSGGIGTASWTSDGQHDFLNLGLTTQGATKATLTVNFGTFPSNSVAVLGQFSSYSISGDTIIVSGASGTVSIETPLFGQTVQQTTTTTNPGPGPVTHTTTTQTNNANQTVPQGATGLAGAATGAAFCFALAGPIGAVICGVLGFAGFLELGILNPAVAVLMAIFILMIDVTIMPAAMRKRRKKF